MGVYGMAKLLQYGTRGGIGWAQWEDTVNLSRLMILMKFLNTPGTMHAVMSAAVDELQNLVGCTSPVLETLSEQACTHGMAHAHCWLFHLWQWMLTRGVTVVNINPGYPLQCSGDRNLIEYISSFNAGHNHQTEQRALLQQGCAKFRVHNLSDIVQKDGCTLTPLFLARGTAHNQAPQWRHALLSVLTHTHGMILKRTLHIKHSHLTPLKIGSVVAHVTKNFCSRNLALITRITRNATYARHLQPVTGRQCKSTWLTMGGTPESWASLASYPTLLYVTSPQESIIHHATPVDTILGPSHMRRTLFFFTSHGAWLDKICTTPPSHPSPPPPTPVDNSLVTTLVGT